MNNKLDLKLDFALYKKEYHLNHTGIAKFVADHNFTNFEFCKICQIPLSEYNKILKGDSDVSLRYIISIAEVFDLTIDFLIIKK